MTRSGHATSATGDEPLANCRRRPATAGHAWRDDGRPAGRRCGAWWSRRRRSSRRRCATNCARRNVALVRTAAERQPAAGSNCGWLLVAAASGSTRRRWPTRWPPTGSLSQQQRMDCLIAATDHLAAEVAKPDTLAGAGVAARGRRALPGKPASGRPRRAGATTLPSAAAATAGVGANLLVLDPGVGTFFQWKQMLGEFCRRGVRPLSRR